MSQIILYFCYYWSYAKMTCFFGFKECNILSDVSRVASGGGHIRVRTSTSTVVDILPTLKNIVIFVLRDCTIGQLSWKYDLIC